MPDAAPERFEVRGRLGKGGFAVVHRVYDNTLKKEVAMKAVKLPKDEGTRMRLLREVDVLHKLKHPSIITLYESMHSEVEMSLHLVLELLPGVTLAKCLDSQGAFAEKDACEIARQLIDALVYMHGKGVIHRDIKPENVMSNAPVAPRKPLPPNLVWKIFDFGLGRLIPGGYKPAKRPSLKKAGSEVLRRLSRRNSGRASSGDSIDRSKDGSIDGSGRSFDRSASSGEDLNRSPSNEWSTIGSTREDSTSGTISSRMPSIVKEVSIGGTAGYMAPELGQLNKIIDKRSRPVSTDDALACASPSLDMFSFGKMLSFCCTGVNPKMPSMFDTIATQVLSGGRYRYKPRRKLSAKARKLLDLLETKNAKDRATATMAAMICAEWRHALDPEAANESAKTEDVQVKVTYVSARASWNERRRRSREAAEGEAELRQESAQG